MPTAAYLAEIDWSGNGSYKDTGENVSARVRGRHGIKISRGRDQIRAMAPPMAGSISLTLDNASRDYSAENAGSPLAGKLLPWRPTRIWATAVRDSFDRADSALTLGSAEVGGAWSATAGTWGISSNRAYSVSDASGDRVSLDAGTPTQRLTCVVRGDIDQNNPYRSPALQFRRLDANNWLCVFLWFGNVRLWKYASGWTTLATTATTTTDDTDYTLEVIAIENSIQVYVDGVQKIDYTLTGGDVAFSGSTYTGAGIVLLKGGSPSAAARWDDFHVYVPLGMGRLDDMIEHPQVGQKTVELKSLGNLSRLRAAPKISTQLYANITTDTALGYVLDAAGWTDTTDRVFDTGKTTLAWWWLNDEDAYQAAVDILNSEGPGAALYEDALGRVHFESRHYRLLTTRCLSSQATFRDTGAEPLHSPPLAYDPGYKNIVNQCTVTHKTRSAKVASAIWSLGAAITLAPNEVRKYLAQESASTPFTGAITPVSPTDYTVTAGSLASVALDRTSGASCTITLTANAGGATLSGLQLRAQLVSVDNTVKVAQTLDVSASQTAYGLRNYDLRTRAEIAVNDLQDFCNMVVRRYQNPRPTISIMVNNSDETRFAQMLRREIGDLVTIVDTQTGLNTTCWIEQIMHVISASGQVHRSVFGCEKTAAEQFWVLNDAVYSKLGTTTIPGY